MKEWVSGLLEYTYQVYQNGSFNQQKVPQALISISSSTVLMNNNKLPALIAVLAIVVGVGSVDSVSVFSSAFTQPASQTDGGVKMLGHLELVATDNSGNIKAYRQTDNIVTGVGKNCVAQRLFGANGTGGSGDTNTCGGAKNTNAFTWIGIGTSTQTEQFTDTALIGQVGNRGLASAVGINANSTSSPYSSIQRTLVSNATNTIAESGLFDASASSHMFARKTFTGIPLNSGDSLTVTWRITYS